MSGLAALAVASCLGLSALAHLHTWWRLLAASRDLEPLWRDLTAAVLDVVLGPADRGHSASFPRQLRLYRRVIEIRDAMIVLRNYVTPADLDLALQHVSAHGVPAHAEDTHITACWLSAALRGRNGGRTPWAQTVNLTGPGATGFTDEITHLCGIAVAFRSPVVSSYRDAL